MDKNNQETDIMDTSIDEFEGQPFRDMEREREEGVRAFRGLMWGTLFSIPIWGLIGLAIWGAVSFFKG